MKYSFRGDRKATIAADWVVESVAGAARRALRRHGKTERCVSIVSWPDRIELALRTAAGTAYAMLPGGPAGTMCSESLWVANPELPLLCLPGPYQNVGAQEQRGLCSGVRDLAGASPWSQRCLMALARMLASPSATYHRVSGPKKVFPPAWPQLVQTAHPMCP